MGLRLAAWILKPVWRASSDTQSAVEIPLLACERFNLAGPGRLRSRVFRVLRLTCDTSWTNPFSDDIIPPLGGVRHAERFTRRRYK